MPRLNALRLPATLPSQPAPCAGHRQPGQFILVPGGGLSVIEKDLYHLIAIHMARKRKQKPRRPKAAPQQPAKSADTGRRQLLWVGLPALIVAVTVLAYIPAIQGGFIWDDDWYVTENANLRSLEGLARIWLEPTSSPQYYPLVFTSFWVEYQLWGLDPTGYHVVNVLLHAACAILLCIAALVAFGEIASDWIRRRLR